MQLKAAQPADGGEPTARFYASTTSYELPAAATVAYLLFCSVGPRLMASRPAFGCKSAMLVYNAYQALFNAVCVAVFVREVRRNGLAVWANVLPQPWDDQPRYGLIAGAIWLHYNNKARAACAHARAPDPAAVRGAAGQRLHGAAQEE